MHNGQQVVTCVVAGHQVVVLILSKVIVLFVYLSGSYRRSFQLFGVLYLGKLYGIKSMNNTHTWRC